MDFVFLNTSLYPLSLAPLYGGFFLLDKNRKKILKYTKTYILRYNGLYFWPVKNRYVHKDFLFHSCLNDLLNEQETLKTIFYILFIFIFLNIFQRHFSLNNKRCAASINKFQPPMLRNVATHLMNCLVRRLYKKKVFLAA